MPVDQYYSVTLNELSYIISGYKNRVINNYKQTRLIMFTMAKLWGDGKINSPEAFWPLPGDDVILEQMKEEEAKELAARFAKINAKNG